MFSNHFEQNIAKKCKKSRGKIPWYQISQNRLYLGFGSWQDQIPDVILVWKLRENLMAHDFEAIPGLTTLNFEYDGVRSSTL